MRKELEISTENVPGTIAACCSLYNICIVNREPDPEIEDNNDDDNDDGQFADRGATANADAVRDALRRHDLFKM